MELCVNRDFSYSGSFHRNKSRSFAIGSEGRKKIRAKCSREVCLIMGCHSEEQSDEESALAFS